MKENHFTVKDITKITGISRRTLHYYDEIELLKATEYTTNGYRLYSREELEKLQIILFLKELDLSLKEISTILKLSKCEQNEFLEQHSDILSSKIQRLENIKSNLSRYLSGENLVALELFQNSKIIPFKNQYEREGKLIFGETPKYKEYEANLAKLNKEERDQFFISFESRMEEIFKLFAMHTDESPYSQVVQSIVSQWVDGFTGVFECDNEILICMAQNYKHDNRFRTYINQFSNIDLSDYIYKAILFYCGEEPVKLDQ